jgi:hypothetical protein
MRCNPVGWTILIRECTIGSGQLGVQEAWQLLCRNPTPEDVRRRGWLADLESGVSLDS